MQAGPGLFYQVTVEICSFGKGKLGEKILAKLQFHITTARDLDAVLDGFRNIVEQRRHLLRCAQVLLRAVGPGPARVTESASFVDTNSRLVCLEILAVDEADVIRSHHRNAQSSREIHLSLYVMLFGFAADSL